MTTFQAAPVKPVISMDLFQQIDIRGGTIEVVEDMPESKKLVRLRVDFGDHNRRIVAGIKQERADPREIESRQALAVPEKPVPNGAGAG